MVPTSRIPNKLRELLDKQGFVRVKQFTDFVGIKYERGTRMIPDRLGALNVASAGSSRPCYRLLEHHIEKFYADAEMSPSAPVTTKSRRKTSATNLLDGE